MEWPFWVGDRDRAILDLFVKLGAAGNNPSLAHAFARELARALGIIDRGSVAQIGDAFRRNLKQEQETNERRSTDEKSS